MTEPHPPASRTPEAPTPEARTAEAPTPAAAGPRVYEVTHRTTYTYDDQVTASYGRAHLLPRDAPGQRVRDSRLEVSPQPDLLTERIDYFGNRCTYVEVRSPHTELSVTATSVVEVSREPFDLAGLDGWTVGRAASFPRSVAQPSPSPSPNGQPDAGQPGAGQPDAGPDLEPDPEFDLEVVDFVLPSGSVEPDAAVRAYAHALLPPDRPLGEALADLVHRIHADIAYVPGATSVTTSLPEVLRRREGVCQDFAQLAVGCLRLAGLPARYVSGYLETTPPPGRPKLQGADASHAWFAVRVPEVGWVDLDPTNDQPADARYVVTAWGRDYTDVPPLKGVIFTESRTSTLAVAVDVVRLDA